MSYKNCNLTFLIYPTIISKSLIIADIFCVINKTRKSKNMYCIECGVQIPDDSKFCQHCGTKQSKKIPSVKEQIADVIIENEITRQLVKIHKSSLNYELVQKSMGWYLAWIVVHLSFLLIGSNGIFTERNMTDDFWPFMSSSSDGGIGEYDIREFLVYTIFPVVILIIIGLVRNKKTIESKIEDNC